jgi:LysM repeat protein
LASIAKKFDTNMIALRKLNHLNKNTIHARMNLLIPVDNDKPTVYAEDDTEARDVPRRVRQKLSSLFGSKTEQPDEPETTETVTDLAQNNTNYNLQPGDTIYMVRRGDTLENVAQRFHIPRELLKTANNLKSNSLPIGKTVIIPTHPGASNSQENNEYLMPGDTIYMVRKGDTLDKIARKFHITASSIRITNLIDEGSLAEGERLVIPTHLNG